MSMSLYWEPAHREKERLNDALKFVLRKYYGFPVNQILNESDIPMLKALIAAEIQGAAELIEAIDRHSNVRIVEE